MKLETIGTDAEKTLLVQAICFKYGFSDTRTEREEIITQDDDGNDVVTYNDTIVPNDLVSFAFQKTQEWLEGIIDEYSECVARKQLEEEQRLIEEKIQEDVAKNKITFE